MSATRGLIATLRVTDLPDVLLFLRREMANLLRAEARRQANDVVGATVATSLRVVAEAFEIGLSRQDFEERRRG